MGRRIRTVKPEWLEDEKLAAASDAARLMSVALWLIADDHGRGRAGVSFLASQVWPYEFANADVGSIRGTLAKASRAIAELVAIGHVELYEVSGQRYYRVRNWIRHQRVDKPSPPRCPEPETGTILRTPLDVGEIRESLANDSGEPRESLATDRDRDRDRDREGTVNARAREGGAEWSPEPPRPPGAIHCGDVADEFSAARVAVKAPPYEPRHTDYQARTDAADAINREAARRGADPRELLRASVRAFCADPAMRRRKLGFSLWLTDPLSWLGVNASGPARVAPAEAFKNDDIEEAFAPWKASKT